MNRINKQYGGKPRGGSARRISLLVARGFREGAVIAMLALLPALALYANDRKKAESQHSMPGMPADALWIDARPAEEYARGHVPDAVNLNEVNWDKEIETLRGTWRAPRPIVVYCSAHCRSAAKIAAQLDSLGFKPVQVYAGGFEEWERSKG